MAALGSGFTGTGTFSPNGSGTPLLTSAVSEAQAEIPMSGACTFDRLDLRLVSGAASTTAALTITVTLFKNGSSTSSLTTSATLAQGSNQSASNSDTNAAHAVSVVAGDTIILEAVNNGTAQANALIRVGLHCQ